MFRTAFAVLAATVLAATTAQAAGIHGARLSKDRQTTTVEPRAMRVVPGLHKPAGQDTIFDNIGFKYPDGLYFCCGGQTVSGPDSNPGTNWTAMQFTPAGDATIKTIDIGVNRVAGADRIILNVAKDKDGVPGKVIAHYPLTGLGTFGECCQLAEQRMKIKVKGGTPYWVFLSTDDQSKDTWAAWAFNTTDQVHPAITAGYSTHWLANDPKLPGFAFAVFGKLKQ